VTGGAISREALSWAVGRAFRLRQGFGGLAVASAQAVEGRSWQLAVEPAMTDADRFEAFVREYQDMVYATAVRLLANPAEAEDIAQTVFLRAFERFATIATSPTAAGWLKTVTTNLCLNHLSRYRARWQFFSELDRPHDEQSYEATLVAPPSADAGEQASRHERLERAVQALPDHHRVPLVLFHFEDMTYKEIAATLGISLAKVRTDIHRGRDALRRAIGG
jgi:RNA polymerase sigma-70 factor, ECF subfamily